MAERTATIARVYSAVHLYYAHPSEELYGSLEAPFERLVEDATTATTRRQFSMAMMRFLAGFENGHTELFDLCIQSAQPDPFRVLWAGGRWIVVESSLPELRGSVIVGLDGVSIEESYQNAAPYISASTDAHRRTRFLDPTYRHLLPERFTLTTDDGRRILLPSVEAGVDSPETTGRWLGDGVAYIRVPAWNRPKFEARAIELVEEFRAATALVIDVRGAGGGTSPTSLIRALMLGPWRYWTTGSSLHLGYFQMWYERGFEGYRQFAYPQFLTPARWDSATAVFPGRLAILTDRHCISACEDFVLPFKSTGRGVVVGDTTGGSTGQAYRVAAPPNYRIDVQARAQFFPEGGPLEGVGIAPDVHVVPKPEDLRQGGDSILQAALVLVTD